MNLSSKSDIWVFPLETVSLSESGFERTYQGTVATVLKKLDLKADASEVFEIKNRNSTTLIPENITDQADPSDLTDLSDLRENYV